MPVFTIRYDGLDLSHVPSRGLVLRPAQQPAKDNTQDVAPAGNQSDDNSIAHFFFLQFFGIALSPAPLPEGDGIGEGIGLGIGLGIGDGIGSLCGLGLGLGFGCPLTEIIALQMASCSPLWIW